MYKELFDEEKQNIMRSFFLNTLAPLGKEKSFSKNQIVNINEENFVAIVTKGKLKHALYNSKGGEKLLYFLQPGEIFGETNYFVGGEINSIVKTAEPTTLSIVDENILDKVLIENPESYRFFIHSLTRKYRISLSQMSDILFNCSKSRIANTLYRLAIQDSKNIEGKTVLNTPLTHQELANLIGCSRITVTKILNELKEDGIIDIVRKRFIISDLIKLEKLVQL